VTSVERAFDPLASWAESLGNGRVVDPPLPVIVDLASLFPPDLVRASWPTRSPSRSPRGLNLIGPTVQQVLGSGVGMAVGGLTEDVEAVVAVLVRGQLLSCFWPDFRRS